MRSTRVRNWASLMLVVMTQAGLAADGWAQIGDDDWHTGEAQLPDFLLNPAKFAGNDHRDFNLTYKRASSSREDTEEPQWLKDQKLALKRRGEESSEGEDKHPVLDGAIENLALKKQIEELKVKSTRDLIDLKEENGRLSLEIKAFQAEKKAFEELKGKVAMLDGEKGKFRWMLGKLNERNTELAKQVKELGDASRSLPEVKGRVATLEKDLAEKSSENKKLVEREVLSQKVASELKEINASLLRKNEGLSLQIQDLKDSSEKFSALKNECGILKTKEEAGRAKAEALQAALDKALGINGLSQKEIQNHVEAAKLGTERIAKLTAEVTSLQANIDESQKLNLKIFAKFKEASDSLSQSNSKILGLEAQIAQARESTLTLAELKTSYALLKASNAEQAIWKTKFEDLVKVNVDTQKKADQNEAVAKKLIGDKNSLLLDLMKLKKLTEEVSAAEHKLAKRNEDLHTRVKGLTADLVSQSQGSDQKYHQLARSHSDLEEAFKSLRANINAQSQALSKSQDTIDQLTNRAVLLSAENVNLKNQIASMEASLISQGEKEKTRAELKSRLELALLKLRGAETALGQLRIQNKNSDDIEATRSSLKQIELAYSQCRSNLDVFATEERARRAEEAQKKKELEPTGFLRYEIIPQAEPPIPGRNRVIIGTSRE
jgi:hypothetical protein